MISQDRYNRLDLELRMLRVELDHVTKERDTARDLVLRNVCAMCLNEVVNVPVIGDAS